MRYTIRQENNDYLIIFYDQPFDFNPNNCMIYAWLGQHSCASMDYVKRLKQPTKKLIKKAKHELKRLGYHDMIYTSYIPKNARKVRLKKILKHYSRM